ncbi:MAG: response regulator [Candidatus Binatia bacterium]
MSYRVLIVDDDEDARVLLARALARSALPLEVATADDGRQALDQVAALPPHLVITDVMMPRLNGFELCIALRANPTTASIPVIMVTALEDDRDRQHGFAVGADDYLTKPFDWGVLTERVAELIARCYG